VRRLVALAAVGLLTAGCTPDVERLVAWVQEQEATASEEGLPCPIYADDLAWRGLPEAMLFVIERESRCQPGAIGPTDDWGLTQIHAPVWLADLCSAGVACSRWDLLDPGTNLDAAAFVYAAQGPAAWSATWSG